MTEKETTFTDAAKQEYKFLIEDLCYILNDFALTPMSEEYTIDYLIRVLQVRKEYDISGKGLAYLHDHDRNFKLIFGKKDQQ